MKNPVRQFWLSLGYWLTFRKFPGVFRIQDALKQYLRIIVPGRINDSQAARLMDKHLSISKLDEDDREDPVDLEAVEEAEEDEHSNSRLSSWHFFLRSISIHTGPILQA